MDKATRMLKLAEEVMGKALPASKDIKGGETVIFKSGDAEFEGMMGQIASVEKDGKVGVMLGKAGPFIVEPARMLQVDMGPKFNVAPQSNPAPASETPKAPEGVATPAVTA